LAKLLDRISKVTIRATYSRVDEEDRSEDETAKPQMGPVVCKQQYDKIWVS